VPQSRDQPPPDYSETEELRTLRRLNRNMFRIGSTRFALSVAYASLRELIYPSTTEAISAISRLPPHDGGRAVYCLQRSLLAAKVSRSFYSERGCVLVGAHFQTGEMHAWVSQAGGIPDPYDQVWVNFYPLLALTPPER
jgi:hypothetical protein